MPAASILMEYFHHVDIPCDENSQRPNFIWRVVGLARAYSAFCIPALEHGLRVLVGAYWF